MEADGTAEHASREEAAPVTDPRRMTRGQLRLLGMPRIVYLRCGTVEGHPAFAIHAADGTAIAVVDDIPSAVDLASSSDMTFVAVH
ncbi:MAG: DUF1150 family protein [Acetobacteraceae bacterium]